jgi:hypothetical protein
VGRKTIQCYAIGMEFVSPTFGKFAERNVIFLGVSDRFVIYIREITYMDSCKTIEFYNPAEGILKNKCPEITNVCRTVYGGPATVETEAFAIDRH